MATGNRTAIVQNPIWWKRRTNLERKIILFALCLLFVVLVLFIALIVAIVVHKGKRQTELCDNIDCIQIAGTVLSSMNQQVDPCENFYEFACGNYIQGVGIPDDNSISTHVNPISDHLSEQLKHIIDQPVHANDIKPFALVKTLYKACMNKTNIEKRGLKPMQDILAKIGGWPMVESTKWNDTFDWRTATYQLRDNGYPFTCLLSVSIGFDPRNSTKRMITLDQPTLSLSREFLIKGFDDKLIRAYYEFLVDVAVIFGANKQTAEKEAKEIIQFEIKLANMSLPKEERRNVSELFHPISIKALQAKYPSISWVEYINNVLRSPIKVKQNDIIDLSVPTFLENFEKLIKQTKNRTLANYIAWHTVLASITYLTNDLRMLRLNFDRLLNGKTEMESRTKECIAEVSNAMVQSVGALYVRNYFNDEVKRTAQDMVNNLKAEFKQMLTNVDWMDPRTKKFALRKVDAIVVHAVYPNELLDDAKLTQLYQTLEVNEHFFLESILNATWLYMNYTVSQLNETINKTNWVEHSFVTGINAYYNAQENSISLLAGILQGIYFSANRPKYMNYGGIGFVIGHEITHGFDDQGRQYDGDGNVIDWWKPVTKQAFLNKTKCIIDQYNNFRSEQAQLHLNGINTQGENIADNGGVKEAYLAYRKWAERNGPEPQLPGLSYTPEQMFWISTANIWCAKYRTEYLKSVIITNAHSPNDFRVIGALMNSKEFAKDFNCPLGSKMNPVQKCQVW